MAPRKNQSGKKTPSRKKRTKNKSNPLNTLLYLIVLAIVAYAVYQYIISPMSQQQEPADQPDSPGQTGPHPAPRVISVIRTEAAKYRIADTFIIPAWKDNAFEIQLPLGPLDDINRIALQGAIETALGKIGAEDITTPDDAFLRFYYPPDGKRYILRSGDDDHEAYPQEVETERVPAKPLPENGQSPAINGKPRLAIIVDDFGDIAGSELEHFAADTPPEVTFAVMPDRPHTKESVQAARKFNHDVMLHMPMQPESYPPKNNPGEHAIFVFHEPQEIQRRVRRFIGQIPDAVGVNNHMGSLATADEKTMRAVMAELRNHELFFIDSYTNNASVALPVAREYGVPANRRHIFIDSPDLSDQSFKERLDQLAALKSQGDVIAITHCMPAAKLRHLNRFIDSARQMGFTLTRVSGMVDATSKPPATR